MGVCTSKPDPGKRAALAALKARQFRLANFYGPHQSRIPGTGTPQSGLKPSQRIDGEVPASPKKSIDTRSTPEEANALTAQPKAVPSGPVVVPVRVFRDEMEIGVRLGTNSTGELQFTVTDTVEEAQEAARALQAEYKGSDDLKSVDNLKLLLSMGIEVHYCSSNPFIGKLTFRFLSVSGTRHARSTYIKVRCEGDRTLPLYAEEGDTDSASFSSKPLILVIIHSNAVATIKVRDKKESTQFYGQARLPVRDIPLGTSQRDIQIADTKDPSRVVANIKAEISYEYLRGTTDEGNYMHPSKVMINKRRLGPLGGLAAAGKLVKHISQQNHWLLSHDNVWPPSSTYFEEEQKRKEERDLAEQEADAEQKSLQGPREVQEALVSMVQASALRTHTENSLRGNTPSERYREAVANARANTSGKQSASKVMNEGMLLEVLGPKEGESQDLTDFKKEMLALMLALHERVERSEAVQEHQDKALQELLLDMEKGKATPEQSRPSLDIHKGAEPFISGTFEYGLGRLAGGQKVYLFINKAQDQLKLHDAMVQFLGVYKTNRKGQLNGIPLPEEVLRTPGHYSVVALLPEDHTYAKGSLFILAPGTKCIVFDMDGTITVGDIQVVTMFAIDSLAASTSAAQSLSHKYDIKARHSALNCVRAWAAKGYQPIYVSGRQGSYYNLTMEWLVKHSYPPGPIHLTRTHLPTLPIYYSVGNFKVEYMEGLKNKGLELFAAYGNTTTDIRAYVASGIPLERIFMIGPHGGKAGTVKIDNFTDHIPDIFAFPDADPPIPYTELLFTAVPGYRTRRPIKGPDGVLRRGDSMDTNTAADSVLDSQDYDDALDDDIDEDEEAEAEAQAAEGKKAHVNPQNVVYEKQPGNGRSAAAEAAGERMPSRE